MGPDENAPYGYMIDEVTQQKRAKKRPGFHKKKTAAPPPPVEQAPEDPERSETSPAVAPDPPAEQERTPLERTADRAPSDGRRRGRGRGKAPAVAVPPVPKPPKETIPFRAGPIAKGMNKFYRRIGKILRVANGPLGEAFVSVTYKDDEDDVTVGEAWEELARVNPAIRGVLMKVVAGGAYGGLFMAHMPILVAILMLDPIAQRFPLGRLLLMLMDDDSDDQEGEGAEFPGFPDGGMLGQMLSGMSQADMAQAVAFAQQMGDQIGQRGTGAVRRGEDTQ